MDAAKLHPALDERVDGEVRFDSGTLSAYAQDAPNYRQVPIGVVVPRTVDAAVAAVAVCRETGAPVLSRGSESTLVTVLHAEIELFEVPPCRSLVVLGYPDIAEAADVVPRVVRHSPLLVEGLDDTLISLEREEHLASDASDKLPEGSGWLMIQFGGDSEEEANGKAHALIEDVQADGDHPKPHVAYTEDPVVEDKLSDVREAGLAWAPRSCSAPMTPAAGETDQDARRTQIQAGHLGREGIHLAQLLAELIGNQSS